jgi:HEAT repeat protein
MEVFVEQMNNVRPLIEDTGSFRDEFDEARRRLIESETARERIDAVKTLSEFKRELTPAHLVGALFDDDVNVRQAAVAALTQIVDADISSECLEVMFGATFEVRDSFAVDGGVLAEQVAPTEKSHQEPLSAIMTRFDDPSREIRNAALIALCDLDSNDTVGRLERVLESASPDRRIRITAAIEDSGLVSQVIEALENCDPHRAQISLSLLCLVAKLGIVQPFIDAIENHDSAIIRRALIKVLTLSGHGHLAESAAKRRLGIARLTSDPSAYL